MQHSERKHALLSASKSAMWLACPPSALLNDTEEDKPSAYAAEGTLAHELAEVMLRRLLISCDAETKKLLDAHLKAIQQDPRCDAEMKNTIQAYADSVSEIFLTALQRSPDVELLLEKRVDYSRWVPGGFGSCDVIIVADGQMEVIDLKYGKGVPVSAEGNSQMRLYALGALSAYSFMYSIKQIQTTIIQPRLDSISSETLTVDDLLAWAEDTVKPAALLAAEGKGEFCPGEKQCRWCKIKGSCRARADEIMKILVYDFAEPATLTLEELSPILEMAGQVKTWLTDVQEYALGQMLRGQAIPGWKVVEGRSNRKFTDHDAVISTLLSAGYTKNDIMKPLELLPLGDIEKKLLGKKHFTSLLSELVIKPTGKPTIVKESDKRPQFNSIEKDFENMEGFEL